jgi:putative transposase
MTNEMMSLRALVEKTPDADILREMIGFAAERLMEMEVAALTGAGHGEKSPERLVQRNGYRARDWETRPARSSCGSQNCARAGIFRAFWSRAGWPRRRLPPSSRRPISRGGSTRSVDDLVKAMGMSGVSKSQVSRLLILIVALDFSQSSQSLPGLWRRRRFCLPLHQDGHSHVLIRRKFHEMS